MHTQCNTILTNPLHQRTIVCLTAAIFVLTQATICVMFGPTMALKGSNDEAVKIAASHMMNQQIYILKIAQVSITALFLGACLLSWGTYPLGIAAMTTVVYILTLVKYVELTETLIPVYPYLYHHTSPILIPIPKLIPIHRYYMIIKEGMAAYNLFIPTEDGAFVDYQQIDAEGDVGEKKSPTGASSGFFKKVPTG